MPNVINVEFMQYIEDRLGKEEGRRVIEVMERAIVEMHKVAEDIALQKKLQLKEELIKELATKEDIVRLEGKIESEVARLEGKIESVREELIGKINTEVARLEGKIESEVTRLEGKIDKEVMRIEKELMRLDKKFTMLLLLILFAVVFLNQNTIEFIVKLMGILK